MDSACAPKPTANPKGTTTNSTMWQTRQKNDRPREAGRPPPPLFDNISNFLSGADDPLRNHHEDTTTTTPFQQISKPGLGADGHMPSQAPKPNKALAQMHKPERSRANREGTAQ